LTLDKLKIVVTWTILTMSLITFRGLQVEII